MFSAENKKFDLKGVNMEMLILLVVLGILTIVSIVVGVKALRKKSDDNYYSDDFERWIKIGIMIVINILFILVLIYSTLVSVPFGHGAVPVSFGKLRYEVKPAGLQTKYPWEKLVVITTQQQSFSRAGIIQAKDTVSVHDNVTFHYILNLKQIPFILENYGKNYAQKLIYPSAAEAMKEAAMDFESWDDLLKNRTTFSKKITKYLREKVVSKLKKKGLEDKKAENAFSFPLVDIKELTPPKQLQTNINLKKAAEQELERKQTQIEIAKKEAVVRSYDGIAVRQAILKLLYGIDEKTGKPAKTDLSNVSPEQMANIIAAMANNRRSETLQTLVEQGGVNSLMVVPAGTPVSATPPTK